MPIAKLQKENVTTLIDDSKAHAPLRAWVAQSVRNYLLQLGEQPASQLYAMVLSQIEAPLLKVVLEHTRQNKQQAAELLGISRATLRKKLKQYNLIQN